MRILLTTWGSRGDFHPFLSLALELQKRGHQVTLGANPYWQEESQKAGIRFIPTESYVSPEVIFDYPEILSHQKMGLTALNLFVKQFFAPQLDLSVELLLREVENQDLLIAHHFVLAAPVVAQKTGIPFVTVTLAPGVIRSRYSAPAGAYHQPFKGVLGEWFNDFFWKLGEKWCQKTVRPTLDLFYQRQGLPPHPNYLFGTWSKQLVLQLYSEHFALNPSDYPPYFHQTGFCFKEERESFLQPDLESFLGAGEKPWLFTLGTVAIYEAGDFYQEAVSAVEDTSERAVLLVGREENRPKNLPSNVIAILYAPHDKLMPHCKGVVHQCGVGGVGQSLRAGIPSVACPYAFDQPNNAMRLEGLGIAVVLQRNQRKGKDFRKAFEKLKEQDAFEKARQIGFKVSAENGVEKTCERIEEKMGPLIASSRIRS